jgi:hypothetical protein
MLLECFPLRLCAFAPLRELLSIRLVSPSGGFVSPLANDVRYGVTPHLNFIPDIKED